MAEYWYLNDKEGFEYIDSLVKKMLSENLAGTPEERMLKDQLQTIINGS